MIASRGIHASALRSVAIPWQRSLTSRPSWLVQSSSAIVKTGQRRHVKTKTAIAIRDLPQGALPALPNEPLPVEAEPAVPTVVQQHLQNVNKYKDCVVLTRVGSFYELYGPQAEQYGPQLNLKVATRFTKLYGDLAMAGFQHTQLDRFLKVLVQDLGQQVAISEEVLRTPASEQARGNQLLYDRKVSRVVTAGTLVDESFMDPYDNNYVLGIYADPPTTDSRIVSDTHARSKGENATPLALCWADISSGSLFYQQTDSAALASVMARIAPREVVLNSSIKSLPDQQVQAALTDASYKATYLDTATAPQQIDWHDSLDNASVMPPLDMTPLEEASISLLISYIKDKMQDLTITFRPPERRSTDAYMQIDKQSLRGLELRTTVREDFFTGSLLHSIRRTLTKSGARLLNQRLVAPVMSVFEINRRLDLVSSLVHDQELAEEVEKKLRPTSDIQRLLQRFSIAKGDADDLLAIAKTIDLVNDLKIFTLEHLTKSRRKHARNGPHKSYATTMRLTMSSLDLKQLLLVKDAIKSAIDETSLNAQHLHEAEDSAGLATFAEEVEAADGKVKSKLKSQALKRKSASETANESDEIWIMYRNASDTLSSAHAGLDQLIADKKTLLESLRKKWSSNSLTLRWTPQLGHFCHIKGKDCRAAPVTGFRTINASKSTKSFYTPEWTTLGLSIDQSKLRIRTEEQRVFNALRIDVISNLVRLRHVASTLDELDVAHSSATLANERILVRPVLHTGSRHIIKGGRHPMVDLGLLEDGRPFTANDCILSESPRILLITGPNMAGKSTFLRQNALISILAQMGSFVPADYAELSLVDKVFSRIGSADSLSKHQSTFMVEMLEVGNILREATPKSLVIMDEIGRGTTPQDGTAVAYACLWHLHEVNKCKALFATHFHHLVDMSMHMSGLERYCTDVQERGDGSWIYVHKMRKGVNRNSHALKVASMAGVPDAAIRAAEKVLEDAKVKMDDDCQKAKTKLL